MQGLVKDLQDVYDDNEDIGNDVPENYLFFYDVIVGGFHDSHNSF